MSNKDNVSTFLIKNEFISPSTIKLKISLPTEKEIQVKIMSFQSMKILFDTNETCTV